MSGVSLEFLDGASMAATEIEGTPLSTLRESQSLEKYAGAKMDDNYVRERDGRVKFDRLASILRSGT